MNETNHETKRVEDVDEVQVFINGKMEFVHSEGSDDIKVELHDYSPGK